MRGEEQASGRKKLKLPAKAFSAHWAFLSWNLASLSHRTSRTTSFRDILTRSNDARFLPLRDNNVLHDKALGVFNSPHKHQSHTMPIACPPSRPHRTFRCQPGQEWLWYLA